MGAHLWQNRGLVDKILRQTMMSLNLTNGFADLMKWTIIDSGMNETTHYNNP